VKISHTPGEWDGTFHNVLTALLNDVLEDGPIEVIVTLDDGATRRVEVEEVDEHHLRHGGEPIDLSTITALELA
jgi:hypothetical protein